MSKYIIKDAVISINSVDLSDRVAEVTINMNADDVDVSTMGTGVHEHLGGLRNDSFVVKFLQDFAAAKVDATLFPLLATADSQPTFPVAVQPFVGSPSATNPEYSCAEGILLDYQPMQGAVGARSEVDVTFFANDSIVRDPTGP
jgi:hypothetical protein